MLTAFQSRWRICGMLVAVLTALIGGLMLASPTVAAHPASVGGSCTSTHAVAIGYSMAYVAGGSIYANLDESVDNSTGQFCGYMRIHAQSRGISTTQNYVLDGNLYYGSSGGSHYWVTKAVTSSGTFDVWGAWIATSCGKVQTYLLQNNVDVGQTSFYPSTGVICR